MRKIIALCAAFMLVASVHSQNVSLSKNITTGIDIFNDFVQDSPDGVKFRTINPGINIYAMYSYPIPKSNISLAIGLGLGMHNLHHNAMLSDSGTRSMLTPFPASANMKRNKLQLTYLDIPGEIRYKSAGGFRLAAGIKAGYLISAHTKFVADNEDGRQVKIKESKLPNLAKWRVGPTFQVGYKWVNVTAFYSLTTVFEENAGPEFYPISIGLALRPF